MIALTFYRGQINRPVLTVHFLTRRGRRHTLVSRNTQPNAPRCKVNRIPAGKTVIRHFGPLCILTLDTLPKGK